MTVTYLAPDVQSWLDTAATARTGALNGYHCRVCGLVTVVEHADTGVTPMFLACRLCGNGQSSSLGYPAGPLPPHLAVKPRWIWYRPDDDEYARQTPGQQDYLRRGGLMLRDPDGGA